MNKMDEQAAEMIGRVKTQDKILDLITIEMSKD